MKGGIYMKKLKVSKIFHYLYAFLMFLPVIITFATFIFLSFNRMITLDTASVENLNTFIENVVNGFSNVLNMVMTNSLFAWVSNSIVYTPFSYIANVFNMSANSPIIALLSYFLVITIIYIVFDILMYIPNLLHRWIDGSSLE